MRRRLKEPDFWITQAGVVAVTAIHILVEALGLIPLQEGPFAFLAHLPVVLYLVPVLYAGFRYGFEGGVLTGAWAALLAVPNLFVWHHDAFEWVGEALFIVFVVGLGAVIAIPVEREQRERGRADAAHQRAATLNRRLALLNDVASTLVRTVDLDETLEQVLARLVAVLDVDTAALATEPSTPDAAPVLGPCQSIKPDGGARLDALLADIDRSRRSDRPTWSTQDVLACPVPARDARHGTLLTITTPGQTLSHGDVELLAAVARQIGVALDNARLHRLEQDRLHAYLHSVTRAQEEERKRIARELHDVAIHDLLLARRSLEQATQHTADALPPQVTQARDRLGEIIDHLRRFSRNLRPSVLDNLGLAPALEWLISEVNARTSLIATFELHGEPRRLSDESELALFRITQEAVHNVERHAHARRLETTLTFAPQRVALTVADDGIGFEPSAAGRAEADDDRLGLMGMHERAQLVGATLSIDSHPGWGTRVTVHLPQQVQTPSSADTACRDPSRLP